VSVRPERVTAAGFDLVFRAWGDCESWGLCATFIAFDPRIVGGAEACASSAGIAWGTADFGGAVGDDGAGAVALFPPDSGNGDRSSTRRIHFPHAFVDAHGAKRTPHIFAAFSRLNVSNDADHRVVAQVSGPDSAGFNLTVGTWCDTAVYDARVSWFAFDPAYANDGRATTARLQTGRVAFQQSKAGYQLLRGDGPRQNKSPVLFEPEISLKTHERPEVCTALCQLDVLNEADHRIHVLAENVEGDMCDVVVKTWSDTQIWSVSVAWLLVATPRVRGGGGQGKRAREDTAGGGSPEDAGEPEVKRAKVEGGADDGKQEQQQQQQGQQQEQQQAQQPANVHGGASDEDDDDVAHECKICFAAQINTAIVPCGHMCVCFDCSKLITADKKNSRCPICKAKISTVLKTFEA
jgi:Zinc finger, C3HC4 type (RING finger)/H-type lectin domain